MLGFLRRILIILGQGGQLDAGAFHVPEKFGIRQVGFQFQEKVKTGIFFGDFGVGSQRAGGDGVKQPVSFAVIVIAHPVDMLLKISLGDKAGQRVLLEIGHRTGIEGQPGVELIDQMLRKHQVADPYGGGQSFGKGVDIDDLFLHVDALKRRDGLAVPVGKWWDGER